MKTKLFSHLSKTVAHQKYYHYLKTLDLRKLDPKIKFKMSDCKRKILSCAQTFKCCVYASFQFYVKFFYYFKTESLRKTQI